MTTLESVESALAKDRTEVAEQLLAQEWDRLGPAEIYYQVIRDDLHRVFQLLELSLSTSRRIDEREAFRLCSNAWLELRVKNVVVSEEMELRVLYKCSAYGLWNMCGDPVEAKQKDYWKTSIDLVDGWVRELRSRKKWYDFLDVDDEVIFRMRLIHNHLYFIKDHPLTKKLPLKEMIFCLAIYVESVNEIRGSDTFKVIINKRNVMQFLMAIASRLRAIRNENSGNPKRSSVLKKLRKTYRRLKQMYSVFKIIRSAQIYEETNKSDYKRCNAFVTVAAFKRFHQICGEAIKNTQDTPNLSAKLCSVLPNLLTKSVMLNSKYRNLSSHGFHLAQLYVRDSDEVFYYKRLSDYIYITAVSFYLLCAYVLHDCTRYLYGALRRCRTVEDVQAMIRYVGSNKVRIIQEGIFRKIDQYLAILKHRLSETTKESLSGEQLQDFDDLWDNYQHKVTTIEEIRELHLDHFLDTVQVVAFSDASVWAVHRFVDSKLTDLSSRIYFEKMFADWELLSVVSVDSVEFNASVMHSYTQKNMELGRESVEQWRNREVTREIVSFFTDGCGLDANVLSDLEEKLHSALSRPRNGYYQNIFSLDAKAQAIGQTLKEVIVGPKSCKEFKQRNTKFKAKLQALRLRDEQELQEVFQKIVSNLQKVFRRFNCDTIGKFIENYKTIPVKAQLAIQYWQLQAMEILCSSGYFGDNFSILTRSVPMIWGKSYRNYLAHDELSYDVLTDTDASKKLINGLVLAYGSAGLNIFPMAPKYTLDGLVELEKKGFRWLRAQRNLLSGLWNCDELAVMESLSKKAELKGRHLRAPGFLLSLNYYAIPEIIIHRRLSGADESMVITLLRSQFHNIEDFLKFSKIYYAISLNLKLFDDVPIKEAMQQFKLVQPHLSTPCVGALVPFLARSDNFPMLEDLLETYAGSNVRTILLMTLGHSEMEQNFLQTHLGTRCSVIGELSDQSLSELFTEEYPASSYELEISVIRNDVRVFSHIIHECYGTPRSILDELDLVEVFEQCCVHGRLEMATHLIELLGSDSSLLLLEESLSSAIMGQHWSIVELLLDSGADPWYESGANFLITIMEGNFKLARRMLVVPIPETLKKNVVHWVAEHGSENLLKFVLEKEANIWKCGGLLCAASNNKRPEVLNFVLRQILEFDCGPTTDAELAFWFKVLNECRILFFFTTESNWIPTIASNSLVLKQFIENISNFLRTDDHHVVGCFHFEDTCELICQSLLHNQLFLLEDHSLLLIDKCSNLIRDLQTLPMRVIVRKKTLFITFQHPDYNIEATVELTIHSTTCETNSIEDVLKIPIEHDYHTADAISMGLRSYLLKFRFIKAATATLTIGDQSERYHFLQIDSSSCIIQEASLNNLNCSFLLNRPHKYSILHFLQPDTPPAVLETILQLGADPTITDSKNRTPFRLLLADRIPLELFRLMYHHCRERNSTHLSDGTHILNLRDDDGYGPLHAAIGTNNFEVAQFLLRNGADPTVADSTGEAAVLDYAVVNRNVQTVQLLLEHSPSLVIMLSNTARRKTVLETAVKINHEHLVRMLLERGASLNHRNNEGCTPLKYAIEQEAIESMKVLLDFALGYGEAIDEDVDGRGTSALEFAREEAVDFRMVRELVIYKIKLGAVRLEELQQKCGLN